MTATNGFADFNLQSTSEGGALSSFGVDYGQDGQPLAKVLSYQVSGFTLDFLLETGIIKEIPSLIKLDVDGIEHLILRGATKTISDPRCKSILVEVNDDVKELSGEVREILSGARFTLENARDGETMEGSGPLHNQIWIRQ